MCETNQIQSYVRLVQTSCNINVNNNIWIPVAANACNDRAAQGCVNKKQRRSRNTAAARKYRMKKNEHLRELEGKVDALQRVNARLVAANGELQRVIDQLYSDIHRPKRDVAHVKLSSTETAEMFQDSLEPGEVDTFFDEEFVKQITC